MSGESQAKPRIAVSTPNVQIPIDYERGAWDKQDPFYARSRLSVSKEIGKSNGVEVLLKYQEKYRSHRKEPHFAFLWAVAAVECPATGDDGQALGYIWEPIVKALRECKNPDCLEFEFVSFLCDAYAITFAHPKQPNLEKLKIAGLRLIDKYPNEAVLAALLFGKLAYESQYCNLIDELSTKLLEQNHQKTRYMSFWVNASTIRFTHFKTQANRDEAHRRLALIRERYLSEDDKKGVEGVDWFVTFMDKQPLKEP